MESKIEIEAQSCKENPNEAPTINEEIEVIPENVVQVEVSATVAPASPPPAKRLKTGENDEIDTDATIDGKTETGAPATDVTDESPAVVETAAAETPELKADDADTAVVALVPAPDPAPAPTPATATAIITTPTASDTSTETAAATTTTTPVSGTVQQHRFKRIPIFIVDYHNEVLEFIYRCIGSRHLSTEKNILVHFDSHPDMVISRDIKASTAHEKETMLGELSIENWIMPMCYAGYINSVIWLKNSWCQQIPVGKYNFQVGHKDDKISVNCSLEYFISEGNYCDISELKEARQMELQVYDMDMPEAEPTQFLKPDDALHFILDIDLDFFSVSNPFLEIYKNVNCYQQLTEIFHYESSDDSTDSTERRKQQLQALRTIFLHLEEVRTLEGLETPDLKIISAATFTKIQKLVETLKKNYEEEEIDWLLIYDSGSTTDSNGLPHHISTNDELQQYFAQFKDFLQRLPAKPVIITIARSAEDDYCPNQQVDFIEEEVLRILYEVFGDALMQKPIKQYMDEEWDVWDL